MSAALSLRFSSPERLAYWYFRLNGFLTTENFIVHPDSGSDQRTDADLLAVRFADRAENLQYPMEDDQKVTSCGTFANVIIAEVKTGTCALNGPWTDPPSMNMDRVLKAIGCVPGKEISPACAALYGSGLWSDTKTTIRLFAIGEMKDAGLKIALKQQITWDEIIIFCVKRFLDYSRQKSSADQWSDDGKRLRKDALSRTPASSIRSYFRLRADNPSSGGV